MNPWVCVTACWRTREIGPLLLNPADVHLDTSFPASCAVSVSHRDLLRQSSSQPCSTNAVRPHQCHTSSRLSSFLQNKHVSNLLPDPICHTILHVYSYYLLQFYSVQLYIRDNFIVPTVYDKCSILVHNHSNYTSSSLPLHHLPHFLLCPWNTVSLNQLLGLTASRIFGFLSP